MVALFARNEWRRAVRSYRFQILLGIFVFQGIADPLGAKLVPKVGEFLGLTAQDVRAPSALDALKAYGSDSTRLALLTLTLVTMTAAADEFRKGSDSGAFVFTKGAQPRSVLLAKVYVWALTALVVSLVGFGVALSATALMFEGLEAKPVLFSLIGVVLFWPLAAVLIVATAVGTRSSWGGFLAGVGLIATGIFELAGVLGGWMPTAMLTISQRLTSQLPTLRLLAMPLAGMLAIAVPTLLWGWIKAAAPSWD